MTEDTIFDMASLTKVLVTTTAILQLYEQKKLDLDTPVARYLPAFAANGKQNLTIRELLTHYSGLPPDIDLKDPWGLAAPDKAEGIRRALASPLITTPGKKFEYSDINFITLGFLVEVVSGEDLHAYAQNHIFGPIDMGTTRYLDPDGFCLRPIPCVPSEQNGQCIVTVPDMRTCRLDQWNYENLIGRIAPTAHDNEGTAATNPDFDHILRGSVHDPTTRRMGGVAGHAGVFSTAADTAKFAQALLDKLTKNEGRFPLTQATLRLATTPQQPATAAPDATIFTPSGDTTKGVATRGFGWDLNSPFSRPRGTIFPISTTARPGSFGHTGFTGTSLWLDPASNTYVILLANAIHPHVGTSSISTLRGEVATAAARALGLGVATTPGAQSTLTGIDVLVSTHFAALELAAQRHSGHLRLALLTNQSGLDSNGFRTIDLLDKASPAIQLTKIFSPEHGLLGKQDTEHLTAESDLATLLPVISLYGAKASDRRPSPAQLQDLDAIVIDLQDAGVRFWTYEALTGYFLEAVAGTPTEIILLDRPNPIGGLAVQGPLSDVGLESYTNAMPLPVRHGLTLGELARYMVGEKHLSTSLTVIPMQRWTRNQFFADSGLSWVPPSPNLKTLPATILYPGVALIEQTNLSVGRGTATPFENIGAPYLNPAELSAYLTARHIPGIVFTSSTLTIAETPEHYPSHGQTIPGLHLEVTDRLALDSPELGLELLSALHHLYPAQFQLDRAHTLLANAAVLDAIRSGGDPRTIAASQSAALAVFRAARQPYLLYQ